MIANSEEHRCAISFAILNAWLRCPSLRLGQFLICAGGNPNQWRHYSSDTIFAKQIVEWADKHSTLDTPFVIVGHISGRAITELQKRDVMSQIWFLWDVHDDKTFRSLILKAHKEHDIFYVEDYEFVDLVQFWNLPEDFPE